MYPCHTALENTNIKKKKNFFFNLVLQQMNNDIGQADYVIHF